MTFEAAVLLGLALIVGALVYAIALILTIQQTVEQHAARLNLAASAKAAQAIAGGLPMPKPKRGRPPASTKRIDPPAPAPTPPADPRQVPIPGAE